MVVGEEVLLEKVAMEVVMVVVEVMVGGGCGIVGGGWRGSGVVGVGGDEVVMVVVEVMVGKDVVV